MIDASAIGAVGERFLQVTDEHSAVRWGSGDIQVFSSPHMIALMEGAAVDAASPFLDPGQSTVGIHVDVAHLAATPIGEAVSARATLVDVDNRRLTFHVQAFDPAGLIGQGSHERFIVDTERFMSNATKRCQDA